MAKPGDKVKVICDKEEHKGILIDKKEDVTVLKLENGYNVGIENHKIKKIELLEQGKDIEIKYSPGKGKKKGLPKISVLHTGGTIASKVDYRTGGVYTSFKPEDLLGMFPELADIGNFDSRLIANMWSEDLRFKHFSVLAEAIAEEFKKGSEGIIIGMGTDQLAVAACGVAFAIQKCPGPVMFVGAQRSSDRGSSDAAMNMVCAAQFIADSDFAGVALCMHDYTSDERCVVLPACKTKKLHSSRRDAFKPVNDSPIAYVDFKTRKIQMKKTDYAKKDLAAGAVVKPRFEEKVGLLKAHANMFGDQFRLFKGYKGLVIEGMGLGQIPGEVTNEWAEDNKDIFPALKEVVDSGCVVVMTTNTIFGRVNMNVYSKGRDIMDLGVIPGEDMLAETALVKLAWLLGNHDSRDAVRLVGENLRGEINTRISEEEFIQE
ncbi:Glu-tRNA(Gln) amidotransferase subunit GatD [Candidatus Woesearchaeota archaeon]|nr:Glu-tRNA(Gln) amidotransferase subunit GatD [Candidatus Woesearchaeota archaeon]